MIIIPAKFGSQRLSEKNFRPFYNGLSLLQIAVIRSNAVSDFVVVNSERIDLVENQLSALSAEILKRTILVQRKKNLDKDPATIVDVILSTIEYLALPNLSMVTCVLPTSPFGSVNAIRRAQKKFVEVKSDRLLSVCKNAKPPFNAWLLDDNGELDFVFPDSPYKTTKSTECPSTYQSNGCVSVFDTSCLGSSVSSWKTYGLEMPSISSIDIDYSHEFVMAQSIFHQSAEDLELIDRYVNKGENYE